MRKVVIVGPFPYPLHGQSKVTEEIYLKLAAMTGEVIKLNTASSKRGLLFALIRLRSLVVNSFFMLKVSVRPCTVYLSLNANKGMFESLIYLFISRLFNNKTVLHHHTYSHIGNKSKIFFLISLLTKRCLHVTQCGSMSSELKKRYGLIHVEGLSNAFLVNGGAKSLDDADKAYAQESPDPECNSNEVTLGFLANITEEKGVLEAIESYDFLCGYCQGIRLKLLIAGPCKDAVILEKIMRKEKESQGQVSYVGSVYGSDKLDFFDSIDIFLFPSLYNNETQGIVNLEAMSRGVPAVAYDQCCVATTIQNSEDAVPKKDIESFSIRVARYINKMKSERERLEIRTEVLSAYEDRRATSEKELDDLIEYILEA